MFDLSRTKKEKHLLHFCFSFTAGDRDRTFLRLSNTDRKEAGGFTLFSELTFAPSYGYTSNVSPLCVSA
jgi:hypothetical protein